MGRIVSYLVPVIMVWGALAQIMPGIFQLSRERHEKLMDFLWGRKTIWIAVMAVAALIGWYISNLENRLTGFSAGTVVRPASTVDDIGLVIFSWTADETLCAASIDASKVPTDMRNKFDVAIICGLLDPTVDALRDTRITVSQLFSWQDAIRISTLFSSPTKDALSRSEDSAMNSVRPCPPNISVQLTSTVWIKPVLLPKGFNTINIQRLADVTSNGGKIAGSGGAVSVISLRACSGAANRRKQTN